MKPFLHAWLQGTPVEEAEAFRHAAFH